MFIDNRISSIVSPVGGAQYSEVTLLRRVATSKLVSYKHSAALELKTKTPTKGKVQELRTTNQEPKT
jgi:hypothetical protein